MSCIHNVIYIAETDESLVSTPPASSVSPAAKCQEPTELCLDDESSDSHVFTPENSTFSKSADSHSSRSADDHASKSTDDHTSKSADYHASKSADYHSSKSADDHASKSADDHASKSADDHTSKSADDHTSKSADDHSPKSAVNRTYTRTYGRPATSASINASKSADSIPEEKPVAETDITDSTDLHSADLTLTKVKVESKDETQQQQLSEPVDRAVRDSTSPTSPCHRPTTSSGECTC